MLTPWLELEGAEERLHGWSDAIGLDLVRLGTVAAADEITDTAVTQPLVVASALLAYEAMRDRGGVPAELVTTGHSVGELAAYAIAGVMTADEAVSLAAVRGAAMAEACALEPTGMTALLGGAEDEVLATLDSLGLTPANRNAKGQIVAAGPLPALERLAAEPPARARLRQLAVAGAFHTAHMEPARKKFADAATKITPAEPVYTLVSNADGQPVANAADAMSKLVAQITRPVRWDLCSRSMSDLGVDTLVELPPSGTLVGIAKREMRGTTTVGLTDPGDITSPTLRVGA